MADREVNITFRSRKEGDGGKKTKEEIKAIQEASKGAAVNVDQLERELKQAETALKKADVGSAAFRKLQSAIRKTKTDLQGLKAGKVDTAGIDRLSRRLTALRSRVRGAKTELNQSVKAAWVDRLAGGFTRLGASIPGAGKIGGFLTSIATKGGPAVAVVGTLTAGVVGLISIVKQGLGTVAVVEDLEASFTTLLGSVELAQAKIADVRQLAASTPIGVGDLATVARQLQTLTDGGFASAKALRLVGDAATVAQRPGESLGSTAQNLALHVGRLFSSLKSGKGEIGESTLRLQEMGLVSPALAFELRELHKEAGKGNEAWALLEQSLGKFEGEMVRRSKTISGATNNLGDAWNRFTGTVAKPVAPAYKAFLQALTSGLDVFSDRLDSAFDSVSKFFGGTSASAKKAAQDVALSAKAVVDSVRSVDEAATTGSNSAATAIEQIGKNYDRATERAKKLEKQQRALASLSLDIALAEIAGDDSLSDVEKLEKSSKLRLDAASTDANQQIKAAQDALKAEQNQLAQLTEQFQIAQQEADLAQQKLQADIAKLVDPKKLKGQALTDVKKQIIDLTEANEKLLGDAQISSNLGIDRSAEVAAAEQELENLKAQETALLAIRDEAIKRRESLQRAVTEAQGKASTISGEIETNQSTRDERLSILQEEIKFLERKAQLENKLNAQTSQNEVRDANISAIEKAFSETERNLQSAISNAEKIKKDRAKEIEKAIKALSEKSDKPRDVERIKEATEGLETGDITKAADLAKAALKSDESSINALGESLQAAVDKFKNAGNAVKDANKALAQTQATKAISVETANKITVEAPPTVTQKVEQELAGKELPKPEPVIQTVVREYAEKDKREPFDDSEARSVVERAREGQVSQEEVERMKRERDEQQPPSSGELNTTPVIDATLQSGEAIKQGVASIANAQIQQGQAVVGALDNLSAATGAANSAVLAKMAELQRQQAILQSQIKNAR